MADKFTKLPVPIRRLVYALVGGRSLLDARDTLYASHHLAAMPPKVREAVIKRGLLYHRKKLRIGSNIVGFYPSMVPPETWKRFPDLEYLDGNVPPETIYPVVERNGPAVSYARPSLALHIHAYYLDGLTDILDRVCLNKTLPDIFVTGPEDQKPAAEGILASYPVSSTYVPHGNIGRDVVPFLSILPRLFERKYDLIGHVHVKKSIGRNASRFVTLWSEHLLSSLIGNSAENITAIDDIARDFALSEGTVSLYLPHFTDGLGWDKLRDLSEDVYSRIYTGPLPDRFIFSGGTMFWSTPEYLAPFAKLDVDWEKTVPEPLVDDVTILHALERIFGAHAIVSGAGIRIVPPGNVPFTFSEKIMELYDAEVNRGNRPE